ncbi:MAG: XRE family transcriptional regulator [Rhodobacteraceae bacterium]|nr:XRE family transcriptional regulator [Paracoccaceae bacterium]
MLLAQPDFADTPDSVLIAKAVTRAAEALGLRQAELAAIIGTSPSQVSKMKAGTGISGKPSELALYVIRVFRSLDAITGGDRSTVTAWMRNANSDLGGVPADLMASAAGLVTVMTYLDAARAPL